MRRAHPAAPADRHLLRPGGQGQRAVLRPQAGQRDALDEEAVDLRPAHQQELHPQDQPRSAAQDLDEFVACYNPANRHERQPTWSEDNPEGRWRVFTYDELMARDKVNLDIFWLRDESLEDSANLPDPDVLAREIVEELKAALEQFSGIVEELGGGVDSKGKYQILQHSPKITIDI